MYCKSCGKEIHDEAVVCPHCGCQVGQLKGSGMDLNMGAGEVDVPSTGLNILSFLIPVVGLVLYLVYNANCPQKAAAIAKWALIGLVVTVVLGVLNSMVFMML